MGVSRLASGLGSTGDQGGKVDAPRAGPPWTRPGAQGARAARTQAVRTSALGGRTVLASQRAWLRRSLGRPGGGSCPNPVAAAPVRPVDSRAAPADPWQPDHSRGPALAAGAKVPRAPPSPHLGQLEPPAAAAPQGAGRSVFRGASAGHKDLSLPPGHSGGWSESKQGSAGSSIRGPPAASSASLVNALEHRGCY